MDITIPRYSFRSRPPNPAYVSYCYRVPLSSSASFAALSKAPSVKFFVNPPPGRFSSSRERRVLFRQCFVKSGALASRTIGPTTLRLKRVRQCYPDGRKHNRPFFPHRSYPSLGPGAITSFATPLASQKPTHIPATATSNFLRCSATHGHLWSKYYARFRLNAAYCIVLPGGPVCEPIWLLAVPSSAPPGGPVCELIWLLMVLLAARCARHCTAGRQRVSIYASLYGSF